MRNTARPPWILLIAVFLFAGSSISAESIVYTLKKGDTLYSLSKEFDVALSVLMQINQIQDPTRIRVGTRIQIPSGSAVYTVKRGDTLYGIAREFSVPLNQLLAINKLDQNSMLKVDDSLIIPVFEEKTSSATAEKKAVSETEDRTAETENTSLNWPHPGKIVHLDDLYSSGVAIIGSPGDPVLSISKGRVIWAAPLRGYGKAVFVKSDKGFVYAYGGQKDLYVRVGDSVLPGMELGSLGVSSHDGEAKVFFFVAKDSMPFEPTPMPKS